MSEGAVISSGIVDVKRLREETQAGMLDCKKALVESGGDFEKARDILRKKGLAAMARRADRVTSEGVISAEITAAAGVLAEVRCETDFVSRTPEFQALGKSVAAALASGATADVVSSLITDVASRCGEKVEMGRSASFAIPSGISGRIAGYVHAGGKVGVLVELHCAHSVNVASEGLAKIGKTLAMQIAVAKPEYLVPADVPVAILERERAITLDQVKADPKNAGKPATILDKIIEGKLRKFCAEICLLEQEFMITAESDAKTVREYLNGASKAINDEVTVARFARLALGA